MKQLPQSLRTNTYVQTLFSLLFVMAVATNAAAQITRYVKPTATGTADGSDWDNASADIQAMIDASTSGDAVWVMAGTYVPTVAPSDCGSCPANARYFSFYLKDGVKLYGSFVGTETLLAQRTPSVRTANPTVLSGDVDGVSGHSGNAYRVVLSVNDGANTVLDGFTISDGGAVGAGSQLTIDGRNIDPSRGGGMTIANGSPTIRNCIFSSNQATIVGGLCTTSRHRPRLINVCLPIIQAHKKAALSAI